MMEAARTSETLVDIDLTTRQYIPKDSELHTRRRENLKSHMSLSSLDQRRKNACIKCAQALPALSCFVVSCKPLQFRTPLELAMKT
jgi:hypothetical protein